MAEGTGPTMPSNLFLKNKVLHPADFPEDEVLYKPLLFKGRFFDEEKRKGDNLKWLKYFLHQNR